ncbi:MAG TPA: SgcJ/EcaC family oxidoreductase [Ktedonobacteraceae bacterium]|nr:SgcJ/EcaC family oxidoreductase [Ktedonobacteraceae bacterium]
MSTQEGLPSADEAEARDLYRQLIDAWNGRNAEGFAALFTEDAHVTGFDGSQMDGRAEIASALSGIFAHHMTAPYISKIRGVELLRPDVAILRAVVGMVPPGQSDLNPALNAIQSLVAVRSNGTWRIVLFQTTPAQFHGRPELVEQLTEELRQLLP